MTFHRKITVERAMMMLPLNVVMVAKIQGKVDAQTLQRAIDAAAEKHPLARTRIEMDDQQVAWFCNSDVPPLPVKVENNANPGDWRQEATKQLRTGFDMETGPLMRGVYIPADNGGHLIVCAHHVVCDGMSLAWFISDILEQMAMPAGDGTATRIPASIDIESVTDAPSTSRIQKAVLSMVNKGWTKKNIRFNAAQLQQMHQRYWVQNNVVNLQSSTLEHEQTQQLLAACRRHDVTVNSAVWAAFLRAQKEMLPQQKYHENAGMARNIRHLMREPVGQSLGFYAASLGLKLPYNSKLDFWENATRIHRRIGRRMARVNPMQMLVSEQLNPGIMDALYFAKFGLCNAAMAKKMLKKMHWHHLHYGYSITNVGRLDIPTHYGALHLERLYGPIVYSDVNEKTVGVSTVGNKLSITMTTGARIDPATSMQLMQSAIESLTNSFNNG